MRGSPPGLITSIESPLDRLNAPRKRAKKPGKGLPPAK